MVVDLKLKFLSSDNPEVQPKLAVIQASPTLFQLLDSPATDLLKVHFICSLYNDAFSVTKTV
jgi:hypothetical protein